ncbi:MAG: hypothetical protein M3310_04855, partial [Actinomycetota bacterium]|nr:hypothetical protein [Actinomycetota bacterium]
HEAAGRQHVERSRTLADQMRGRFQARVPPDAPAREQGDVVTAEKPRGGLGGVAGVAVLRHQNDEAAVEAKVKRSEEERERRFRHPRAGSAAIGGLDGKPFVCRSELLGERLQPLALGELAGENV